ncbi:MAG: hypothetical protein PHC33_06830, partial [Candidatus Omnitrophica bacterium]|nr:hypothetical protein [Candidatus Omnitrophota bacterium]
MNQKKIYDHLADIYLDSTIRAKEAKNNREIEKNGEAVTPAVIEPKPESNIYKKLFIISIAAVCVLLILFAAGRNHRLAFESSMVLAPEAVKVDFTFEPAQKSIYSIRLAKLNLSKYKTLKFLAKTENPKDEISLRIELDNSLNEKSEVYINTLSGKWKDYAVDLADFKKIS